MLFITLVNLAALAACSAAASPAKQKVSLTYDELYNLHTKFYDNFLYPLNVEQMKKVESPFFAPDVQGRVDVSRNFDAAELNTEYVFGLFSDPSQVSFFGTPYSYEIVKFAGYENVAAASTRVWFNHTTLDFKGPVNIDTFIAFNEKGQIWQYDAVFKWMDGWIKEIYTHAQKKFNTSTLQEGEVKLAKVMADSICQVHEDNCHGDDQQYKDMGSCLDFMLKIRPGTAYELGGNTLICRGLHKVMLPYRPSVHCPHIGPGGGGMCTDVDRSYMYVASQKYFNHTSFVPGQ